MRIHRLVSVKSRLYGNFQRLAGKQDTKAPEQYLTGQYQQCQDENRDGIFPAREKQADFPDISPSTIVDAAAGLKDASAGTWIQPVEDMCLAAKMMAMRAHHGDVIFTVGAGDITDMDQVLLTALEAHRESCE